MQFCLIHTYKGLETGWDFMHLRLVEKVQNKNPHMNSAAQSCRTQTAFSLEMQALETRSLEFLVFRVPVSSLP